MLYSLLKWYARLMLPLWVVRLKVRPPQALQQKGPVLYAANHPNSFLDGIILTTLLDAPLYSLARGDAFEQPLLNRIFRRLRLLPVYRTSEGVENLEHNYTTFRDCLSAFAQGRSVLIFSEGRCENEWKLRPLKKGTARLALSAWHQKLPLTVVPLAFNYSSFKSLGKELHLRFGQPLSAPAVLAEATAGRQLLQFNQQLHTQLAQLVYTLPEGDEALRQQHFVPRKTWPAAWLFLPGLCGWLVHAPLFVPITFFTRRQFRHSGHYDSMQTSLLLLSYPVYVALLTALATHYSFWGLGAPLVSYATAWAGVRLKYALGW